MTTSPSGSAVRIGALAPLSSPGWAEAGRQLLAGLELAAADVNAAGGIGGGPLELLVRDTAADPARAEAAVTELAGLGVTALAGEYHSVVARAAAARAVALGLPFLCSSAVLDALTDEPTELVARLAPAQSHGWRRYAEFLRAAGHERIAVAAEPSAYWAAGTRILREHLGTVVERDARAFDPADLGGATAVLVLAGHPEPAASVVRALRRHAPGTFVGAPAGQPEFADWAAALGADGAGIPFLRYLPERLGPLGAHVDAGVRARLGRAPSFVAFEGYDTVLVLAQALRRCGPDRARLAASWPDLAVDGSRGPIRFTRTPGVPVWQWAWPPTQLAERDPARPDEIRPIG